MGRVYNALVRADRWEDRQHAIGSAASVERALDETPSLDFEDTVALTEEPEPLACRPTIAGPALHAAALAPSLRRAAPSSPRPVFESPATSQPPTPAFEEPSEVLSIERLKAQPHLASITGFDRVAAEQCRALAANVLELVERRKLKTVLISSAESAEGKTTIAINLAWSLAQKLLAQKLLGQKQRRRVLLIDATRTFDTNRMLGINPSRGWIDLASGSCEPNRAIVRVDPSGLYALTSGASSAGDFAEGLSSPLVKVIAGLAPHFDVIVVDSSAILDSSDTPHLAKELDGTIIVARACRTHHDKVTAARKMIPKAKRLGVVLNESDAGQRRVRSA